LLSMITSGRTRRFTLIDEMSGCQSGRLWGHFMVPIVQRSRIGSSRVVSSSSQRR